MKTLSNAFTVAVVQPQCSPDIAANVNQAIQAIEAAADHGAKLVCLPELFASLYFCQSEDHCFFELAEKIPGPTTERLGVVAKQRKVVIVAGLFERRAAGLYHNSAVVIENDGSLAGHYRKMHIPDDPFYYEKFYFTPGDLGFKNFPTSVADLGICICWDQWFPEAARITALQGAQVLLYPTAIGWLADDKAAYGESQRSAWQTMMRAHAIANGTFVVAANRVGCESNIEFWGSSFVSDPYGNVLCQATTDQSQTIFAEIDLSSIETARTHWPFLRDRRIDAYQGLSQRLLDAQPN
jgi:N-carbamoylputrescine amidase